MAHDDMHVIMYKILSYLYECMKRGVDANPSNISFEVLGINQRYWTSVMKELIDRKYVKGYVVSYVDNGVVLTPDNPSVTMAGVEFLMDNSLMSKARDFVLAIKDFIPMP